MFTMCSFVNKLFTVTSINNRMYSKHRIGNRKFHSKLLIIFIQINSISLIKSEEFRETSNDCFIQSVSANMLSYVSDVKKITMLARSILQWIKRPFCRAVRELPSELPWESRLIVRVSRHMPRNE